MNDQLFYQAVWKPGWHELDQSLFVGQRSRFRFQVPEDGQLGSQGPLVFCNQATSPQYSRLRDAKVVSLKHPKLGPLERIDTDGLDYVFETVEGRTFLVNAEEEPGVIYDSEIHINDWSVWATLADIEDNVTAEI
jgi:hypothetical protein